jgi:hypothetical protein
METAVVEATTMVCENCCADPLKVATTEATVLDVTETNFRTALERAVAVVDATATILAIDFPPREVEEVDVVVTIAVLTKLNPAQSIHMAEFWGSLSALGKTPVSKSRMVLMYSLRSQGEAQKGFCPIPRP